MINKVPQDDWRKFATLRAFYSYMWSFPGKQLVFMGCEFGQRARTGEATSLEWWVSELWGHGGLQRLFRDLNHTYARTRRCTSWTAIPRASAGSTPTTTAATRWPGCGDGASNYVACVTNFADPLVDYEIGLPSGRLGGDPEHRRADLRRLGRVRQPGRGQRARRAVGPLPGPRAGHRAAARLDLAQPLRGALSDFKVEVEVSSGVGKLRWADGPLTWRRCSAPSRWPPTTRSSRTTCGASRSTTEVGHRRAHARCTAPVSGWRVGCAPRSSRRRACTATSSWRARLAVDPVYGPHGFSGVLDSILPKKRLIGHVLFRDEDGRVLLLETTYKEDWELPGGVVEPGETPRAAAEREVAEVGLVVELGQPLLTDWMPPAPRLVRRRRADLRRRRPRPGDRAVARGPRQGDPRGALGLARGRRGARQRAVRPPRRPHADGVPRLHGGGLPRCLRRC